jgi:hypothetical protein
MAQIQSEASGSKPWGMAAREIKPGAHSSQASRRRRACHVW